MNRVCEHCDALHWISKRRYHTSFANLKWESCCKEDDVVLFALRDFSQLLRELLTEKNSRERDFRQHIRSFNFALIFTFVNYKANSRIANRLNNDRESVVFQIQKKLYHLQESLHSIANNTFVFAQLFFYDSNKATTTRNAQHSQLNEQLLRLLTNMLHDCNSFISLYKTTNEQLRSNTISQRDLRILLNSRMQLILKASANRRRNNLFTSIEVITIIINNEYDLSCERDIVFTKRHDETEQSYLRRISQNHVAYMSLHYVLFFSYDELDFHWELIVNVISRVHVRTRFCQRAFYKYRLHVRNDVFFVLHRDDRLFQQYVVDAWVSCDVNKLNWLRNNQSNIRTNVYNELANNLRRDNVDATTLNRRFILSFSYTSDARFMQKLFQDNMIIVKHFERFTFFVTFTINSNWFEIRDELKSEQIATNRSNIVTRVFEMKTRQLIEDVKKRHVFDKWENVVWIVKYQKRELSHIYLLMFLRSKDRFLISKRIDDIVCAKLSNFILNRDEVLRNIIQKQMTHESCEVANFFEICMIRTAIDNHICFKHYSRSFLKFIVVEKNEYSKYKRRDDERTWIVFLFEDRTFTFDNRWIVSYNSYLFLRYKTHINVKICTIVKIIQYVHKYVYKDDDQTILRIDENDEIVRHLHERYIDSTQIVWKLFEYATHEKYSTIHFLFIHLFEQQSMYFEIDLFAAKLQNRLNASTFKLLRYFDYNRTHENDKSHVYQNFSTHHVWKQREKRWISRRNEELAIDRIYFVSSLQSERFYLRLLLTIVANSTSYEHLRTIDDVMHSTFQIACCALDLMKNDREWIYCFTKVATFASNKTLRALFDQTLIHEHIANSSTLWERFAKNFCSDLSHQLQSMSNVFVANVLSNSHFDYELYLLNMILSNMKKSLTNYRLFVNVYQWNRNANNSLIANELNYDMNLELRLKEDQQTRMNSNQLHCFNTIVAIVEQNSQNVHFFVQELANINKIFLYRTLCHHFRARNEIVICVISSSIATLLLFDDQTSHSRFKISLQITNETICNITRNTHLYEFLRRTKLIIWDEMSMQHKHCFTFVHRTFTNLLQNKHIFDEIFMILNDDFAQILFVVSRDNREAIVDANIQQCFFWSRFRQLILRQNMRMRHEIANQFFANWIERMFYKLAFYDRIKLSRKISQMNDLREFVNTIFFANLMMNAHHDFSFFNSRVVLIMHNDTIKQLNDMILRLLQSEMHTLNVVNSIINKSRDDEMFAEFLRTLKTSFFSFSRLCLKIKAFVMLLRNLYSKKNFCNETRLMITRISRRILKTRILNEELDEEIRLISRIDLFNTKEELSWIVRRKQFSIRFYFAIIVNKTQDQSLNIVNVDLRMSIFFHEQLYVILSRVTNVSRLCVLFSQNKKTKNIVYSKILLK